MLIEQLNDTEFKAAQTVCEHYDVSVLDLFSCDRTRAKNKALSVFLWAMKQLNPAQHIGVLGARVNVAGQQRVNTLIKTYGKLELKKHQRLHFKLQYIIKSHARNL